MPIMRIDETTFDHQCAVCGQVRKQLPHSEAKLVENKLSEIDVVRVLVISCADCDSHESLNMRLDADDPRPHSRLVRALLLYRGWKVAP